MKKLDFNKHTYTFLGLIAAVCIVVIVLGSLSSVQLLNVFNKESSVVGIITEPLPGDENKLVISEDESVFFSYTFKQFSFQKNKQEIYEQVFELQKLTFNSSEKNYRLLLNTLDTNATIAYSGLFTTINFSFKNAQGVSFNSPLQVQFEFFIDRTKLTLNFSNFELAGYLNKYAESGFNLRIIEGDKQSSENMTPGHELNYTKSYSAISIDRLTAENGTLSFIYGGTEGEDVRALKIEAKINWSNANRLLRFRAGDCVPIEIWSGDTGLYSDEKQYQANLFNNENQELCFELKNIPIKTGPALDSKNHIYFTDIKGVLNSSNSSDVKATVLVHYEKGTYITNISQIQTMFDKGFAIMITYPGA